MAEPRLFVPSLHDMTMEAEREVKLRIDVFGRRVAAKTMNRRQADARITGMESIVATLRELEEAGAVREQCPHCGFACYRPPARSYVCPQCRKPVATTGPADAAA
jgi:hypothetical protein